MNHDVLTDLLKVITLRGLTMIMRTTITMTMIMRITITMTMTMTMIMTIQCKGGCGGECL